MISEAIFKREKKVKCGRDCTKERVLSSNKEEEWSISRRWICWLGSREKVLLSLDLLGLNFS